MLQFSEIEKRIINLRDGGSKFSTERMIALANALQNPERKFKSIHIAGTNGKGSTSAILEAILRAHGLRVGMFTSPHLLKLNERIQINREEISDDAFVKIFEKLDKISQEISKKDSALAPTFFEYITAEAFEYFKDNNVDFAVIETGLGGRLDATNILTPEISVITSIGFDHMQFLGNTLPKIAAEKAGIIKKNVPVICGIIPEEALLIIEKKAKELNAPIYKLSDFFDPKKTYETSLLGIYQRKNIALAMLVCKVLKERNLLNFDEAKASSALKNIKWNARWQKINLNQNHKLILDCSHNTQGAEELDLNLEALIKAEGKKPIIACGILGEERAIPLLKVISKHAKEILFLKVDEPRALDFAALETCLPQNHPKFQNQNLKNILDKNFLSEILKDNETLVITGSCYLAGEALAIITNKDKDSLNDRLPQ